MAAPTLAAKCLLKYSSVPSQKNKGLRMVRVTKQRLLFEKKCFVKNHVQIMEGKLIYFVRKNNLMGLDK
jgi:hypothetical protein